VARHGGHRHESPTNLVVFLAKRGKVSVNRAAEGYMEGHFQDDGGLWAWSLDSVLAHLCSNEVENIAESYADGPTNPCRSMR
jgi:hypothetical protein